MTAIDIISSSFRLIGVLASGETPTGAEGIDALATLNSMIDEWNSERLSVFHVLRNGGSTDAVTFPFVPGQQAYTIGEDGASDFNVVRPAKIERASIEYLGNPNNPLEIPLRIVSEDGWRKIPVKETGSNIPRYIWIDNNFPNRTMNLWPEPSEVHNLILYYWQAVTSYTLLSTNNSYPPGYEKAIRYNLAVDLAPEYGREPSQTVLAQAARSKGKLKSMNTPAPEMSIDPMIPRRKGHYDFFTDEEI